MRKSLILVGVVVLLAAAPAFVLAGGARTGSDLDRQVAKWTTTDASTSSPAWRDVPGLSRLTACTLRGVSAILSVTVQGAPVRFRVIVDAAEGPFKPAPARFVPNGRESFSYTFVRNTVPFEADDTHVFGVQWQSPSGGLVTLAHGVLDLLYQQGTHSCP